MDARRDSWNSAGGKWAPGVGARDEAGAPHEWSIFAVSRSSPSLCVDFFTRLLGPLATAESPAQAAADSTVGPFPPLQDFLMAPGLREDLAEFQRGAAAEVGVLIQFHLPQAQAAMERADLMYRVCVCER